MYVLNIELTMVTILTFCGDYYECRHLLSSKLGEPQALNYKDAESQPSNYRDTPDLNIETQDVINVTGIEDINKNISVIQSEEELNKSAESFAFPVFQTSNNSEDIKHSISPRENRHLKIDSGQSDDNFRYEPVKELPLAIIIAGPAAAVGIFLFLCIAYYFHNLQLNSRVKRLSITLYVTPDHSDDSIKTDNNNITRLKPARTVTRSRSASPTRFSRSPSRDGEMFAPSPGYNSQRRKSVVPPPTLSVPSSGPMAKRGSNFSAIADKELLTLSAPKRRHSTFLL